jgi:hypothetical protein
MISGGKMAKIPQVPSYPLGQCFEDVRKIYDQYSHATFSRAEVANALGYSASSGPFGSRMASFRVYNLLEEKDGGYKATDLFKALKITQRGTPEFSQYAIQAIKSSTLFEDILSEFRHKIPEMKILAQRLEIQKKFTAEKARFIASVFIESLNFAGVLDSNNNFLEPKKTDPAIASTSLNISNGRTIDPPSILDSGSAGNSLQIEIALANNRMARVVYPRDISKDDAAKIGNVLGAIAG